MSSYTWGSSEQPSIPHCCEHVHRGLGVKDHRHSTRGQSTEKLVETCGRRRQLKVTVNTKEKKKTDNRTRNKDYRSQVVIPCVEGVGERVHWVMKKYGVVTAMRPHTTLRHLLVHPQDKVEIIEQGRAVYQIPCNNCGVEYIGPGDN